MPTRVLVFICIASSAFVAHGVEDSDLARCAAIANALDRLDCYDGVAQRAPGTVVAPASAPTPIAEPEPVSPPPSAPVVAAPAAAPPPAPAKRAEPHREAEFGLENKLFEETPDQIESRYDGSFTGWTGKTLFRLENGQVWQQAQNGRVNHRKERPLITIKKGAFGSYRLNVEGLNKTVRVKRIK